MSEPETDSPASAPAPARAAPKPYGEDPSRGRIMPDPQTQPDFCRPMDQYLGMWHAQTPLPGDPHVWKYSGGLATYPYQSRPMAVYAPEVGRTFFCYGGTSPGNHLRIEKRQWDFQAGNLLQMVSYYDHATASFARPVCVFDKWCADPHDNPTLQIDAQGFLWLFSPSHGAWTTRSFIHRSRRPFDISAWETVADGPLFAYPQPWFSARHGWCLLHVIYEDGRRGIHVKHSADGYRWTAPRALASMAQGHYAVSWADPECGRIAIAFDYHPPDGGLEARTNLYYLESPDWGQTWQTIDGTRLDLPLLDPACPALALDLQSAGELNYLRDLKFDAAGRPVVVFMTSRGWQPGPASGPHRWNICRWDGAAWVHTRAMPCDNNYDHGELDIGADGVWRIIAPTEPGPQPGNPGGEVALWTSRDLGATWQKTRQITAGSAFNHTFCRRPLRAQPDFAAFWADGHARMPSESRLWYCDAEGTTARMIEPQA